MPNYAKILIKKYFDESSLVRSDIESFNHFMAVELQKIIDENKYIEPTIIPPNVESFKIRLDKIEVKKKVKYFGMNGFVLPCKRSFFVATASHEFFTITRDYTFEISFQMVKEYVESNELEDKMIKPKDINIEI